MWRGPHAHHMHVSCVVSASVHAVGDREVGGCTESTVCA